MATLDSLNNFLRTDIDSSAYMQHIKDNQIIPCKYATEKIVKRFQEG